MKVLRQKLSTTEIQTLLGYDTRTVRKCCICFCLKQDLNLSYRVVCPKQYVSICLDYLRLQNDIQAERLRQKGGRGTSALLRCERKYQIRNLKTCHLLIQCNTISPLQKQTQLKWKQKESITCLHWLHLANGKAHNL